MVILFEELSSIIIIVDLCQVPESFPFLHCEAKHQIIQLKAKEKYTKLYQVSFFTVHSLAFQQFMKNVQMFALNGKERSTELGFLA